MQNMIWEQVGEFLNKLRSENITRNTSVEIPGYKDTQQELEAMREKCEKTLRSLPDESQQMIFPILHFRAKVWVADRGKGVKKLWGLRNW